MIQTIHGTNVPDAFFEGRWVMEICGQKEETRNGPVLSIPYPVMLEIDRPWERVLFDPIRDANPFFHVMEFVWMLASSNDAEWIAQFNKRMMEYADDGILRGAYGWRWSNPTTQIQDTIHLLRTSPESRQAVISMWDPTYDGPEARTSDRPCNTHIYLRNVKGRLDITVCNRSNDFFWGMLGSNVVHFTMLHEFISQAVGLTIGKYRVFTNNLHTYTDMPNYEVIMKYKVRHDPYLTDDLRTQPLLDQEEKWEDFIADAITLVEDGFDFQWNTTWFNDVAAPMYNAYLDKENRDHFISCIGAPDWHRTCSEWNIRRKEAAILAVSA